MSYAIELLGAMFALSVFFFWWALPLTMAALVPYYLVSRHRFGGWVNPFIKSDCIVPMASTTAWMLFDLHGFSSKSMANLVELPFIGLVWAALFAVRLAFICVSGHKNSALCMYANGLVVFVSCLFALLLPMLPE